MKPATQLNTLNFHLLTTLGLSIDGAEIVLYRIRELDAENIELRTALEKIAASDHCSRMSFNHGECPSCIARAALLQIYTPAKPNQHPMSSVDCRP